MTIERDVAIVHDYDLYIYNHGLADVVSDIVIPRFELNRESILDINSIIESLKDMNKDAEVKMMREFMIDERLCYTKTYVQFT